MSNAQFIVACSNNLDFFNTTESFTVSSLCGDGVVDGLENCDDFNAITEDCPYGERSCTVCTEICIEGPGIVHFCGDEVLDAAEACDEGFTPSQTCEYGDPNCRVCTPQCTLIAGPVRLCGDNVVDPEETCDDGNLMTEDCQYNVLSCQVCDLDCQLIERNAQTGGIHFCGDGVIDAPAGEVCDDGATPSGLCPYGEESDCQVCTAECTLTDAPRRYCGDGVKDAEEDCDDGDAYNNNGCTNACTIEAGFVCTGDSPSVCDETPSCGDGNIAVGFEACDDGNTNDGDGCDANCTIEVGYSCVGVLSSICTPRHGCLW